MDFKPVYEAVKQAIKCDEELKAKSSAVAKKKLKAATQRASAALQGYIDHVISNALGSNGLLNEFKISDK